MARRARSQGGFTYIGLLVSIVIMGLLLTLVSRVWTLTERREREIQLIYIGHTYRMAISSYFSLGHRYPATLDELLTDERFPVPRHHLRRLYADPMTGKPDWSLIMTPNGQGIMGVASSSPAAPIKRDGFELIDEGFKGADCYCGWQFIYYANRWNRAVGTGAGGNVPGSPATFQPGQISTLQPGQSTLTPAGQQRVTPSGQFEDPPAPSADSGAN